MRRLGARGRAREAVAAGCPGAGLTRQPPLRSRPWSSPSPAVNRPGASCYVLRRLRERSQGGPSPLEALGVGLFGKKYTG